MMIVLSWKSQNMTGCTEMFHNISNHFHDYKLSLQHLELVDPAQVEDGDDLHDVGGVDRSESHVEPFFATMHRWSSIKLRRWSDG